MNALLNTLIPGDREFPQASDTGLHDALLAHDRFATPYEGIAALLPDGFSQLLPEGRAEVLAKIEIQHPALFNGLIVGTYSLYYTRPSVAAVIEKLTGHTARPPQPDGHSLLPFDPRLVAVPANRRPHYRPTPEAKNA